MKKAKRLDLCYLCGGKRERETATIAVSRDLGSKLSLGRNAPATLCGPCGAAWVDEETAQYFAKVMVDSRKKRL